MAPLDSSSRVERNEKERYIQFTAFPCSSIDVLHAVRVGRVGIFSTFQNYEYTSMIELPTYRYLGNNTYYML